MKHNLSKLFTLSGLFSLFFVFGAVVLPLIASAQSDQNNPQSSGFQIVPCNAPPFSYQVLDANGNTTGKTTNNPLDNTTTTPCDFAALIVLIQRIINFAIYAATFIAIISIVWAGFLYLTAGGSEEKVKKAHDIFKVTGIGFAIALCSWLVVYTILTAVIDTNAYPNVTNILQNQ